MKFKIVTPERILLEIEADSITLPTLQGEITVLPNHIPLISELVAGEIKYKRQGKDDFFAVSGGIIEARNGNEVVILADSAEFGHEIDIERAEKAKEAARKLLSESYGDEKRYADISASLQKHLVRLNVSRKHRSRRGSNIQSDNK